MADECLNGDDVDLISSLPDEILQHILSSLKTATAIKTSTLSKRWRHVWSDTPSLYFGWICCDLKADSINKTLARYTARKMTSFRLYAGKINKSLDIDRWIELAMSRNVENMWLDFSSDKYNIPDFFYINSSMKQLRIWLDNNYSDMNVPICSVSWTSLKKLSLICCNLSDECIAKILAGCPVLESLTLYFCKELKVLDLSKAPSLRTLEVSIQITGTQIVAPHIRCLILENYENPCTLVDISSLTQAKLDIGLWSDKILTAGFCQAIIHKMVEKLQNVEKLTFGSNLLKILSIAELNLLPFPSFKVKDLTLETTVSQYVLPGIVRVLQNSPELKKLTVQTTHLGTLQEKRLDNYVDLHWLNSDQYGWRVFRNIFTWNVGSKHVVLFLELMLKTTKTLEKMVLRLGDYIQGRQFEELLEMVPMLSHDNNVSIVVISTKSSQRV